MAVEQRQIVRLDLPGHLEARVVEALRLEIRQLARRHGLAISDLRVEQEVADAAEERASG